MERALEAFNCGRTHTLALPRSNIDDAQLAEGLSQVVDPSRLQQLHLLDNKLTDASLQVLERFLRSATQLRVFNVARNGFTLASIEALAKTAIDVELPLLALNVDGNPGALAFKASTLHLKLQAYMVESRERVRLAEKQRVAYRLEAKQRTSSRKKQLEMCVVGGGIGGLGCALALAKSGIKVVVLEKDPAFNSRAQGYGLTMQQGTRAIKVMGIEDSVAAAAAWSAKHFIFAPDGKVVAFWGPTYTAEEAEQSLRQRTWQRVGSHNLHIPRQKLREALYHECLRLSEAPGKLLELRWDAKVIDIEEDQLKENGGSEPKVSVLYSQGGEHKKLVASAVIGCDGIHSACRKSLVGDPLEYLDIVVILGIFAVDQLEHNGSLCLERAFQTCDGETRIFVMPYSLEPEPMSMWQLTFYCTEEEALKMSKAGPEALRTEALQRCGNWHEPIPSMLKATGSENITGYPVYDRLPHDPSNLAARANSRVILAGDAAHCMSPLKGQGANQALLDGVVITEALKQSLGGDDVTIAQCIAKGFRACEKEIFDRTKGKVMGSRETVKELHHPEFTIPQYQVQRRLGAQSPWGKEVIRRVEIMHQQNIRAKSPIQQLDNYAFSPNV